MKVEKIILYMHPFKKKTVFKSDITVTTNPNYRLLIDEYNNFKGGRHMKTKLHIKILTTLFITIFIVGSLNSQNVISTVNVQKNAKMLSKQLDQNLEVKELKLIKANNWMQNKNYLDNNSSIELYKVRMLLNEKIIEKNRSIESWMTDKSFWNIKTGSQFVAVDEKHKLEEWMFNKKFWTICDNQKNYGLEDWMFDKRFWIIAK